MNLEFEIWDLGLILPFILLFLTALSSNSQPIEKHRKKEIVFFIDTIYLDTLSIIPGSILLLDENNEAINPSLYTVDFINAGIIPANGSVVPIADTLTAYYDVFPFNFSKPAFHKKVSSIFSQAKPEGNPFLYTASGKNPVDELFNTQGLNKSGSISRGITFGNNQDVVVNSAMNLELSGKLNENIDILAAITDNNIPFQPEGNTQQLQEFDKVFIQFSNSHNKLIAGDFELRKPRSYFMNFYKKAQGALFKTDFLMRSESSDPSRLSMVAGAAISKGKYSRNISNNGKFNGIEQEGNQGPYKVRGAENEPFIVILSGTERVYLDGALLVRGQDNDYVIDYNLAEITFTPTILITKDKRIVVEFEYSEKNYTRSLLFTGSEMKQNNLDLGIYMYSEQDSRNQPIQQELDDGKKQILKKAGDDPDAAFAPDIDSTGYIANQVLYKKVDSVVNYSTPNMSYLFKDVYLISSHPDSAEFRLGFSNVGDGNGNYKQVATTLNGKAFQWVAPRLNPDGSFTPQGSFEPVVKLVTPKKKQMVAVNADYRLADHTTLSYEGAVSNNDLNTFSELNNDDDIGFAHRITLKKTNDVLTSYRQGMRFESVLSYENASKTFSPIDRYRTVEFERDWNLNASGSQTNEHLLGGELSLFSLKGNKVKYQVQSFYRDAEYKGIRHSVSELFDSRYFFINGNASYLQSAGLIDQTQFLRHKAVLGKKIKWFTAGVREESENNFFRNVLSDTLMGGSFAFFQWEAFLQTADTASNGFNIGYKERRDRLPLLNRLSDVSKADELNVSTLLAKNQNSRLKTTITFRNLDISDSTLTSARSDNTLIGRMEYHLRLFKSAVTSGTFYELGTGIEYKKEFYYIKVPAGDGIYSWDKERDYNGNGIEDLNEFEVAAFRDKAEYLRLYTPTAQLQRTRLNQFNQTFDIRPATLWSGKTGIKKAISRFSNQTAYRIDKKTTLDNLAAAYNPLRTEVNDTDLISMNYSLRNTLFFNRISPVFGIDFNYQSNRGKTLLTNGFDSRSNQFWGGKARTGISRIITLTITYNNGMKSSFSEYFKNRTYRVSYYDIQPEIAFQRGTTTRIKASYKYSEKTNIRFSDGTGGEQGFLNNIGLEVKRSAANKGYLQAQVNYIEIIYRSPENSPVAYDILEGLHPGQNITWNISYQQNLSDHVQMSLSYDGRKSEKTDAVHTGGVQVRAFF